jgi:gluconolactonase
MADGSVLVVEVVGGRLTRVGPDGSLDVIAQLGGGPNGAAIGPDGAVYVCNNGGMGTWTPGCIQRVDLATGAFDTLYEASDGERLVAPNDLVFDGNGGFWFTDLGRSRGGQLGAIHHAMADGSRITNVVPKVHEPNGIGMSPDGTRLYWAQTTMRMVQQRAITGPGTVAPSNGVGIRAALAGIELDPSAVLAGLPGYCQLDSLAIEAGGNVCVGTLLDPGITVITPEGDHELVRLPAPIADSMVTNICFGGADLRTVYVTLSTSGQLLRARWPRPGLALVHQVVPAGAGPAGGDPGEDRPVP